VRHHGSCELLGGIAADPAAIIATDPGTLVAVLWHGLARATHAGAPTRYLRPVTAYRFHVPPELALLTLADASGGLSALFAFDAHMAHHLAWLDEAADGLGYSSEADEEMKDTRALASAQTEPIRALRTELAELAADAEAQLPPDVSWTADIVSEHPLPRLPDTLGPKELAYVEQSYRTGMTKQLLAACDSLGPLAERLREVDDDACQSLAERIAAFVVAIRGPGPGPQAPA
jgi:hypothetical protein